MTGTATATSAVNVSTMTELSSLPGAASITGWYMYGTGWTTSNLKWQGADTGTNNSGGVRQLYDTSDARALGSTASSSYLGYFGLVLKNTSQATINNLSLSYDAVMNRNPSTTVNKFTFGYLVSSVAVSTATTAAAPGTFAAGLSSSTLVFETPTTGTGSPARRRRFRPCSRSPLFPVPCLH